MYSRFCKFGKIGQDFSQKWKNHGYGFVPRGQTFKRPGSPRLHLHPELSGPSVDGYPFCSPATALSSPFANWPASLSLMGAERQPSLSLEMMVPSFIRFRCHRLNHSGGALLRMEVEWSTIGSLSSGLSSALQLVIPHLLPGFL